MTTPLDLTDIVEKVARTLNKPEYALDRATVDFGRQTAESMDDLADEVAYTAVHVAAPLIERQVRENIANESKTHESGPPSR